MKKSARYALSLKIALVSATCAAALCGGASASEVYAIERAKVIPMTSETVLKDYTVVVRDGKIAQICPRKEKCAPEEAIRIDAKGKYLIPGLIDSHNHLQGVAFDGRDATRIRTRNQSLRQYVMFGVTTVRDPSGGPQVLEMRDEISRGELFGPRVFASARLMDGDPPLFPGPPSYSDPKKAAKVVRETKADGYDFVKAYSTLSPEVFDAIMDTASEVGLTVAAHVPIQVPIEHALQKGLRSIEHLTGYDVACAAADRKMQPNTKDIYQGWAWCSPEKVKALAEMTAKYEVWNVPTLDLWDNTVTEFDRPARNAGELAEYEHPFTPIALNWLYTIYDPHDRAGITGTRSVRLGLVKALSDAGAPLLTGTDITASGFSLHKEMELFVEAGLTPYQTLTAATSEAARYFKKEGEFGTIVEGASADLVLLDKNPLKDIRNARTIRGVMLRGAWWNKEMIDDELAAIKQEYAEDAARIEELGVERIYKLMSGEETIDE